MSGCGRHPLGCDRTADVLTSRTVIPNTLDWSSTAHFMSKSRHIIALLGGLIVATAGSIPIVAQAGRYGYQLGYPNRLAGTYQLDRARSDNPQQVVYKVTRSLQVNQNDRRGYAQDRGQNARPVPEVQNQINRLDSPETLSIDLNGRSVTIMSSNAPRLVFAPMDGIGPSPVPTAGR
jgi:hypothetical protein